MSGAFFDENEHFQPFSCVFLRMIDVSDIAWKDLPGSAQMLFSKIGQETYSDYEKTKLE